MIRFSELDGGGRSSQRGELERGAQTPLDALARGAFRFLWAFPTLTGGPSTPASAGPPPGLSLSKTTLTASKGFTFGSLFDMRRI